jgi:hypothetical protein
MRTARSPIIWPRTARRQGHVNALFGILDNPEMVVVLIALASDGPRLFRGEPENHEGIQCSF